MVKKVTPFISPFITSLVGHLPPFIALFIAYGTNRGGSIHNLDNAMVMRYA
jgi:hypothetical protein